MVTAVTAQGETPFCATVCQPDGPAPIPIPPGPTPPGPISCVDYFLVNTTTINSDFTWDPYPDATGYNVYISDDSSPTSFVKQYSNIPVSVLPLDCQSAIVTAITPTGESPTSCAPVHFCSSVLAPCGHVTFDPLTLAPWAWFRADSFPPSTPDSTLIGDPGLEWLDQSGNGRHAVTDTATLGPQPEYVPAFFGTMPGIRFGGVGGGGGPTRLKIPSFSGAGQYTVIAVHQLRNGNPGGIFLGTSLLANLNSGFGRNGDRLSLGDSGGVSHLSSILCTPNVVPPLCGSFRRNASNDLIYWENSIDRSPGSTEAASIPFDLIGATKTFAFYSWMIGHLGEVLIFDRYLSDAQVTAIVERYLRPRWCFVDCAPES